MSKSKYSIQMHSKNESGDYDDLFPKTKATLVLMSDGETDVETAIKEKSGGGSLLTVTFDAVFAGKSYTISGGGEEFIGTVPTSSPYKITQSLSYTSTTYTISCTLDGTTYSSTATTGSYYGSLNAEVKQATLTLTFGTGLSGTYYVKKNNASGEQVATGTATAGGSVNVGVAPGTYYAYITMNNLTWSGTASPTATTAGTITFNTCALTVSVDSGVAGQSYTLKNASGTTVDSGTSAGTSKTVYVPRTSATYTYTTTAPSAYGGATFTGSASTTTSSTTASISITKATLTVTYASDFKGRSSTISGTNVSITTTVPSSSPYQKTVYLPITAGTTTITSTTSDGTSYSTSVAISSATTYSATLNSIDATLNNNSFAIIKTVSNAGTGASYWSVGDRKSVSLNGKIGSGSYTATLNGTYYMSVLSFNHNNEGGIHFQFGWTALTGGVQIAFTTWTTTGSWGTSTQNGAGLCMNTTNTNVGGWPSSLMRGTTLGQSTTSPTTGSFMAALPSDLRSVMRSVTKTTNKGNNGGATYETSTDYLWLPSEYEVFGSVTYSGGNQGQVQYDYYKGVSAGTASKNAFSAASKQRYNHQVTGTAVTWWERSPFSSATSGFCYVISNGDASFSYANYSCGIAPCLSI